MKNWGEGNNYHVVYTERLGSRMACSEIAVTQTDGDIELNAFALAAYGTKTTKTVGKI
jgi:hypothetical protein